jgi:sugar phosphate isomerase/epimerase
VTLDTGNLLAVKDDPVEGARKLAPFTAATHIKDLVIEQSGLTGSPTFSCTPTGRGLVNVPAILQHLHAAGYRGLLCIEIHDPSREWIHTPEEELVRMSVEYLKPLAAKQS